MPGSNAPVFPNAVTLGGRLVDAPVVVPNEKNSQIRFTLAHPFGANRAYFLEINVFGDLADAASGLGKGDHVLIKGRLTSYQKAVTGAKGRFHYTRVSVVAEDITRKKAGRGSAGRPRPPAMTYEPEPGYDDE